MTLFFYAHCFLTYCLNFCSMSSALAWDKVLLKLVLPLVNSSVSRTASSSDPVLDSPCDCFSAFLSVPFSNVVSDELAPL